MRLIHASDYASPYPGSFIPMVRAALRLGLERGLRAEAVLIDRAEGRPWVEDLRGDGIPVRFVPHGGLAGLLDEDDGPTILHVHFSGLQIEAARAARARRHTRLWWHVHTPLHPGPVAWARNAVRFGLVGRAAEEILCVAPDLADAVRRRLGPRRKVDFFPNAIDLERFRPLAPEERRAARERLGLPQDARVLTHFGHDWMRKGGDLYSGAVRKLADRRDDFLAVTFKPEGGTNGLVRRLDPTPRVEDVYAAADAFVSPSRAEGMPFAVTEALACGTPVIATDIPGQRYVCESHSGCRLVGLDEWELTRAIDEVLAKDPAELAADMAAAREWIERNMDLRVWAERLFERYAAAGALA
ncbi:MAG TPA: glycosyltransferase [Thermoleophilaceae bacterium]|nr:glycosyltransferase [Thermoleophilaceae bacterium]